MAQLVWKQYSQTVKVHPKFSALIEMIELCTKQQQQCMVHSIMRTIFDKPYRSYRRGKNRCGYCGAKI